MNHPATSPTQNEREFHLSDKEFTFIATLANRATGIQLPPQKRDMLYSRLVRRLRVLGMDNFAEYCVLLSSEQGAEELPHLINAVTTNLTHFFREAHHFDHLRDHVLRRLHTQGKRKLRIWSAGCSSGMEAYSIAMTMHATIDNIRSWDARILATDIDTNMLDKGVAGEYPLEEYQSIPPAYRTHVTTTTQHMQMGEELKKLIAFKHLNLLGSFPMKGTFDAIFCRNVVIYFDKDTQKKLFARISRLLSPHGFLYIGHSENITNICPEFTLVGRTIYALNSAR
jgi:chemotaxis protein methyltransferase CheR